MGLWEVLGRKRASAGARDSATGLEDTASGRRARRAAPPVRPLSRHQADPLTGRRIEPGEVSVDPATGVLRGGRPTPGPAPKPVAPPAASPAGGLVVGSAELRRPPLDVPDFYRPVETPPPPPAEQSPAEVFGPAEPYDRILVRKSFEEISDRTDVLVRNFYAELFFALGNEALRMFPAGMTAQREDFGRALVQWVVADDPDTLTAHLDQLGADHRKFDVSPRHYTLAGQALIRAWKGLAGSGWTSEVEEAVTNSYVRLATIMIDGAVKRDHEPATWGATVVSHTRVTADFAVLRLQPDAPYFFKAGQYCTVEVASHRALWRQMSIASAPRPDNTFDIQVRAIGATGVSAALVMHTKPGDRVRIGPPRGNGLVLEPGTVPHGVLCVCSGTGAAPISAVVESLMTWRDCPPVYAYVGARTQDDLYPVERLSALARAGGKSSCVRVYGVVSDDPDYTGYRGRVEQIVPRLHDWAQLGMDVLVAGPDSMIATTVVGLTDMGVPIERIHFDQYELVR